MYRLNVKGAREFEKSLLVMRRKAWPHATRDAVNETAFLGRKVWAKDVKDSFVNRNPFTARSLRVEKARGTVIVEQHAVLGSVADYMDEQEAGETKKGRGKGLAIPTPAAAGQQGRVRTRVIQRRFALRAIQLHQAVSGSRARKNAAALSQAVRSGRRVAFLDHGDRRGIVRVMGSKKKPRVRVLYDLSHPSVRRAAEPTLGRTIDRVRAMVPAIYAGALLKQLRRHGISVK